MESAISLMELSGVLSSWEALDTNSVRCFSRTDILSLRLLNASPSLEISSFHLMSSFSVSLPPSIASILFVNLTMRFVIKYAAQRVIAAARSTRSSAKTNPFLTAAFNISVMQITATYVAVSFTESLSSFFNILTNISEIVTSSPFCKQILRLCAVRLYLFTQAAHVHVHRSCIARIVVTPYEIQ